MTFDAEVRAGLADGRVGVERVDRGEVRHRRPVPLDAQPRSRPQRAAAGSSAGAGVGGHCAARWCEGAAERERGDPAEVVAGVERAQVEQRLGGGLFDVGAVVVERVEVGGGDGDDPDEAELGVALGQLAFAGFDVGEALALAGVDPEPFAFLHVGVGLAGHHLAVRGAGRARHRDRLHHDGDRARRAAVGEQRRRASPAPTGSCGQPATRYERWNAPSTRTWAQSGSTTIGPHSSAPRRDAAASDRVSVATWAARAGSDRTRTAADSSTAASGAVDGEPGGVEPRGEQAQLVAERARARRRAATSGSGGCGPASGRR